jgi:hypothetical protein
MNQNPHQDFQSCLGINSTLVPAMWIILYHSHFHSDIFIDASMHGMDAGSLHHHAYGLDLNQEYGYIAT